MPAVFTARNINVEKYSWPIATPLLLFASDHLHRLVRQGGYLIDQSTSLVYTPNK